jgi:hypothetical protein
VRLYSALLGLFLLGAQLSVASASEANVLLFSNGVQATFRWEKGPVSEDESILEMQLSRRADHSPVEAYSVPVVNVNMPAMGHGSSPTAVQRMLDSDGNSITGFYKVAGIYLVMKGQWDISLTLKNEDETSETKDFTVNVN